MSIWLIRAGSHGEYEQKFLQENRVYVTWERLSSNLSLLQNREALFEVMKSVYPDSKPKRLQNWVSQVWPFAHEIKKSDLVILPSKTQPSIYIGEVSGEYNCEPKGPDPFFHWRPVKWISEAIPRTHFGKDLLFSFGAFMTICRIQRNNAESRILSMKANGWKPETIASATAETTAADTNLSENSDLEILGRDQIAKLISARFKGHGLALLVEAVLKAQGYSTYRSPEGADGGIDILAGAGPLGFGSPRLCVQVKSQESPVESKALNELRGAMQTVNATEGLFVSWSGFKSTVYKQAVTGFFSVRLWTQKELLEQIFANYEKLDEELRAELPIKRIWTVASQEAQEEE